jgi:undecaprenyl-phosphate 4-deoxy-4-formamido-L-arabinose transferase
MTDSCPSVAIVIAVYDDAGTIVELKRRIQATMEARGLGFEIVFVDDGSRDGTADILRGLEAQDERVRVFELTRNFGQAAALACGLFEARGRVVVTLDGDLQNPPEEIPKLLDAIQAGAGVATARRGRRYEGFVRWLGSRCIHWLACRLTGVEIEDYGGNFKAYRRDVLEVTKRIWAPGKPFFPLALWLGHPVAEVTVHHEPRRTGRSRYTLMALLRINFDLITSFTTLPLALLGMAGASCLAFGGTGLLLVWAFRPAGWLPAATALTVIAIGAVFFAGGVLGLYLGRVYRQVAGGEPAYVVKRGPQPRTA